MFCPKTSIAFFVTDIGRGIPEDSFEFIFDRFAQTDNVVFKEGTGLGLSSNKRLAAFAGRFNQSTI